MLYEYAKYHRVKVIGVSLGKPHIHEFAAEFVYNYYIYISYVMP